MIWSLHGAGVIALVYLSRHIPELPMIESCLLDVDSGNLTRSTTYYMYNKWSLNLVGASKSMEYLKVN